MTKEKRPSDHVAASDEERLVFAVAPPGANGGVTTVIIGIPLAAYEMMKDGKTQHADLGRVGIPVRFVLFGAENRDACLGAIAAAGDLSGSTSMMGQDMGIATPKPN